MADKCKECGCICKQCNKYEQKHNDMHLHVEIENLRQRLVEKDNHIVTMETQFLNEAEKFPNGELASLKEEVVIWQDKYTRLYESHKRIQKVNQNLEDKLLRIVDKCETEKGAFTKDIVTLSHKLADANYSIHQLTKDNEKYRNDVNLAIQLLQCKPSNFVGQKYETLSPEVQAKVRNYITQKPHNSEAPNMEIKSITVPISTFPPTAMVYNIAKPVVDKQDANSNDDSKPAIDMVSAAIMAKVLEDREKERIFSRHCATCTCHRNVLKVDNETQTLEQNDSRLPSTKDYFKTLEYNDIRNTRNNKQSDVQDMNLNYSKSHSQFDDLNVKHVTSHLGEVTGSKRNVNSENFKIYRNNSNAKTYLNLKNSNKYKTITDEVSVTDKSKSMNDENRNEGHSSLSNYKNSMSNRKSSNEMKIFDDQAKINMINERLWKSNWLNSKSLQSAKESEVQDVINQRIWKNNNSLSEKSPRLTVIEVKSSDDLTNENEKIQQEPTTSPSFSGDSMLVSSSDPSSLSSDAIFNQSQWTHKKGRISGPQNCLMRVTPGSKNILLDNASTYETVLYTSGSSRPSTALVHVTKSSQSGRSASISSEENVACSLQESTHLQRVAQWVDTLSSDCQSQDTQLLDTSFQNSVFNVKLKNSELNDSLTFETEQQTDLMTFEGSSDDEPKFPIDYIYQDNISKEMEETYLKLAASLDPVNLKLRQSEDIDLMTIEKYRKQQKNSNRSSQATFHS